MLKKFFSAFVVTVEHDIDASISTFTSTIEKLEAAAVAKLKEAEDHAAHILHLQDAEAIAKAEGQRAAEVAEKIKGLIS